MSSSLDTTVGGVTLCLFRVTHLLSTGDGDGNDDFLYSLIESILFISSLLIHIPILGSHPFNAWNIKPLTLLEDDSLLEIARVYDLSIIADELSL